MLKKTHYLHYLLKYTNYYELAFTYDLTFNIEQSFWLHSLEQPKEKVACSTCSQQRHRLNRIQINEKSFSATNFLCDNILLSLFELEKVVNANCLLLLAFNYPILCDSYQFMSHVSINFEKSSVNRVMKGVRSHRVVYMASLMNTVPCSTIHFEYSEV